MGAATRRVTTTRRYQYEITAPAAHIEVLKALHWAGQDFLEVNGRPIEFDDDVWVTGDGELITVYFDATVGDLKEEN